MESSCQVKTFYDTLNNLSILIEKLKDQAKNIISNFSSDYPHYYNKKEIIIRNLHNHAVLSSSNNIQQLDSNEVSNCILPENSDGKYVVLTTNGKNWVIKRIF
jgi:hypothetical protein